MVHRRDYPIFITVNGISIRSVVIDSHYEIKHKESVDDKIILELVKLLDGKTYHCEAEKDGFKYFKTEPLVLGAATYRLIWLLEKNEIYIGVVNAFRRNNV